MLIMRIFIHHGRRKIHINYRLHIHTHTHIAYGYFMALKKLQFSTHGTADNIPAKSGDVFVQQVTAHFMLVARVTLGVGKVYVN